MGGQSDIILAQAHDNAKSSHSNQQRERIENIILISLTQQLNLEEFVENLKNME